MDFLDRSQLVNAIVRCYKSNFAKDDENTVYSLLESLLHSAQERNDINDLKMIKSVYDDFKKKREEARAAQPQEEPSPQVVTGDFQQAFPTESSATFPEESFYNVGEIISKRGYADNALLVYGPFADELSFQIKCYAKYNDFPTVRWVDCEKLVGDYGASTLLSSLRKYYESSENKELLIYLNAEALLKDEGTERAVYYYLRSMKAFRKKLYQVLLCKDINADLSGRYKTVAEENKAGDIYGEGLEFATLAFPDFNAVHSKFCEAFGLSKDDSETEKYIKKHAVSLGFTGVKKLLQTATPANWKETLKAITQEGDRLEVFEKFAGEHTCIRNVLVNWDYKPREEAVQMPETGLPPRDYKIPKMEFDEIDGLDTIRNNVNKLMNYENFTVLQRCCCVVKYALDNGEMLNLINLEDAQKEFVLTRRWEIAYEALVQLMDLPRGKICFDIEPSEGFLGLCCDGGKTIRMHKKYIQSVDAKVVRDAKDTLFHEMYHALQHSAIAAMEKADIDKQQYYLVHFDIWEEVEEWKNNFGRYKLEPKDWYHDQVVEAMARIFAAKMETMSGKLNIPKLSS